MHKHFFHIIIVISTLLSSAFGSTPTYASQSTARQSGRTNNASAGNPTLSHGQSPRGTSPSISKPQASCTPTITIVNGVKVYSFYILGSCDWTVPNTVNKLELLMVGGGGGGGAKIGGGGGGGQVVSFTTGTITPGSVIPVTVGSPGMYASSSISNAINGGPSAVVINGVSTIAGGGNFGSNCTYYIFWITSCSPAPAGGNAIPAIGVGSNLTDLGGGGGGCGGFGCFSFGAGYRSAITGIPTVYGNGGMGGSYGIAGNSTNTYADTNIVNYNLGQMGAYATAGDYSIYGGRYALDYQYDVTYFFPNISYYGESSFQAAYFSNSTDGSNIMFTFNGYIGLSTISGGDGTSKQYFNGSLIADINPVTANPSSLPVSLWFGAIQTGYNLINPTYDFYSDGTFAFGFVTSSIFNSTQNTNLYNRIQTYQTTLGRAI